MSELKRRVHMRFNDVDVGRVDIFDDGQIIPEFIQNEQANDCIYFLTVYALTVMLQGSGYTDPEVVINLN